MEDYGHDEPREGPARLGLYHPHGAASTVCGFLLLMLFGRSTGVGQWLIAHGISIVFTWPAAVISAVVVSFPLVYRTALGALRAWTRRCSTPREPWGGPSAVSLPSL